MPLLDFPRPTIDANGNLSIDRYLKDPTLIPEFISQVVGPLLADDYFMEGPTAPSGTAEYTQTTSIAAFYGNTDPMEMDALSVSPVMETDRRAPVLKGTKEHALSLFTSDRSIRRNNVVAYLEKVQAYARTWRRAIDAITMADLALSPTPIPTLAAPAPWTTVSTDIWDVITRAKLQLSNNELAQTYGYVPDTLHVGSGVLDTLFRNKPLRAEFADAVFSEWSQRLMDVSGLGNTSTMLDGFLGFRHVRVSYNVPVNFCRIFARQKVGQLITEIPFETETWEERRPKGSWSQSRIAFAGVVTNPLAIVDITGV